MKRTLLLLAIALSGLSAQAQLQRRWADWHQWGSQPDGTFLNPVLPADYSDLDCIRVGDDYYFAFLEFGRNSTNRQTYVNKLEFNADGTIRQVAVTLHGVGQLLGAAPAV